MESTKPVISSEYAKLEQKIVQEMRKAYAQGSFISDIAEAYELPHAVVYDIVTRRTWRHVP